MKNTPNRPLPCRNGVNPSQVWLPIANDASAPYTTVLAFLTARFLDVEAAVWLDRMVRGEVVTADGAAIGADSPYLSGAFVYYYREVPEEVRVPFEVAVLFEDDELVVVDKPHFLPVTPAGLYLQETVLVRLRRALNIDDLTPIHRLDRETAGVMLFSKNRATRGAYQHLFATRQVTKTYEAIAPTRLDLAYPLTHRSRLVQGEQFFVMQSVAGEANSETTIELIEYLGEFSRYRLMPLTGKKHQLRVHLSELGMPILNDDFYPVVAMQKAADFNKPLLLLAKHIEFTDPLSGLERRFSSRLSLTLPPDYSAVSLNPIPPTT